ncbi:MAG: HAD-IIB family hydrolase [Alphaproteobacteria bacterium]|nr:HAD-IIB family hydrolase [Alphaproteobacteria bacterium]
MLLDLIPIEIKKSVSYILTDIDDTLTTEGKLPACAYSAMEKLSQHGIHIIPITGRPAGWCDMIARFWPVKAVVGENGAFYFCYKHEMQKMVRFYVKNEQERLKDRHKLDILSHEILNKVPGCAISADQSYRVADLAIDFAEDVIKLDDKKIVEIVDIFHSHGAHAKISSIHINGWFGDYNKLSMTKILFAKEFKINLDTYRDKVFFIGDSPNDEPMFEYFNHSVGVANILNFKSKISTMPKWITQKSGGEGFAEFADLFL